MPGPALSLNSPFNKCGIPHELDHFQTALDIASGIGNGLPVLGGKKLSEAVELSLYQFQKFEKNTGAPLRIS